MNHFIKRLPLPTKLIILGIIPLIFLIIISAQLHKERTDRINTLENYLDNISRSFSITKLIDELQNERRFSFDFVLKDEGQGELYRQRSKTDLAIDSFILKSNENFAEVQSYTFLNDLKNIRSRIDRRQSHPFEVMTYFTNVIFRLSTINNISVDNVPYLQPINEEITGQKILADMITYLGIVRSNIYYTLYTKQVNDQAFSQAKQVYDIYNTFLNEFKLKSSLASIETYNNLEKTGDFQATIRYLDGTIKLGKIDTTISSDKWWEISSNATDKLRFLQQTLLRNVEKKSSDIFNSEKAKKNLNLALIVLILSLVIFSLYYIIKVITLTLKEINQAAIKISNGASIQPLPIESNDVIGSLVNSINQLNVNNNQLAEAAEAIGAGKFEVPIHPRSKEDVLGNAVVRMRDNLQTLQKTNEDKLWIQTGVYKIYDHIKGDRDVMAICRDTLKELAGYIKAEMGLFYLSNGETLEFCSGFAVPDLSVIPKQTAFGETLIGQAAVGKEIIHLKEVPDNYFRITSGSGSVKPKNVFIIPLIYNDVVEGVIELATINEWDDIHKLLVDQASITIAIGLQSSKSRARLQELYEETQAQAEELQSQHSELENLNADLEAQTQRLQASEEELKVQQEELLQANQELEERSKLLEERNQLILERNLEIQQKAEELELSTKYKSEFLANMSHELRTPLNSILLLSRLLAENHEKNLSPEQIEYASVIQSSGNGLLALIDEILDLSKIEAGKMELEYSHVPVKEIAHDMHSLFAPIAKEKNLALNINVQDNVPATIQTDKLRLEQILKNLLSNALKFTFTGSVNLDIYEMATDSSFLCFSVRDTGIGIPKDKQLQVFEAFQQADGSTRRKFGGTGLGLSISRELTRLLGGEIKLVSEPEKGSEFTIYIPKAKPAAVETKKAAESTPKEEIITPAQEDKTSGIELERNKYKASIIPKSIPDDRDVLSSNDKTILIIEDDTNFAKALLDYTRSKGYKGIVAVRGDEGIELAHQIKPIGILLDIQLPVKDGWEVMEELKSSPTTRHIPVHIMSSHEVKKESLVKGAIDFINKPVALDQMQDIFRKIELVLNKKSKKVMIVEENPKHAKALAYFLETFNVNAEISKSVTEGVSAIKKEDVDCVILDMGIPDPKSYETLENIKKSPGLEHLPIIIFTGKSLSIAEEQKIKQYADSIVIKTAHSYQRILDEVSIFLHLVEENKKAANAESKQNRLGALSDVLSNKKILITDDDVRNIFSLTKILENHKMNVLSAIDGKEALKQLEEHPDIDVVLMDIMMPEMDGYETMKRIRQNFRYRNLPVIAVTAKAMTGDREKCIQAGASDYISKPVDTDQLLSLLRVWLYEKNI